MDNEIFIEENCIKEEATVNLIWANIFGLIVLAVAALFFGIPFYIALLMPLLITGTHKRNCG
jgi:hypothetical protein